jgi:hypothetical protein
MDELLERLMLVNEDSVGITALYRVYRDVEQNHDPDDIDVVKALRMMEQYYAEFLDWYEKCSFKLRCDDRLIIEAYRKRLREIKSALVGGNPGDALVTLDTSINQWHRDFSVIAHLEMDQEDLEMDQDDHLSEIVGKVAGILQKLGRLPEKSPYI